MKDLFREWYEPDDDELASFITEGRIALDTTVLFSLYRVNAPQRKQVLDVFAEVAERLWIPYQVGLEYQRGRLDRIREQSDAYGEVSAAVDGVRKAATKVLRDKEIRAQVVERISAFEEEIGGLLDELQETHSVDKKTARHDDPVRNSLDDIFTADRVGSMPVDLEDRKKRALERIELKTPPGYKDAKKGDPTGDVLIWFELLDMGAKATQPVLFITDDVKEDWYRKVNGEIVGPLTELRLEWATRAQVPYHQTTLGSFLFHAKELLKSDIDDDTISGVNDAQLKQTGPLLAGLQERGGWEAIERLMSFVSSAADSSKLLADLPLTPVHEGEVTTVEVASHALNFLADRLVSDDAGVDDMDARNAALDIAMAAIAGDREELVRAKLKLRILSRQGMVDPKVVAMFEFLLHGGGSQAESSTNDTALPSSGTRVTGEPDHDE